MSGETWGADQWLSLALDSSLPWQVVRSQELVGKEVVPNWAKSSSARDYIFPSDYNRLS